MTAGPVWSFTTWESGPLDHFNWGPIASNQQISIPFDVTVTAKDVYGDTVLDYNDFVPISGYGTIVDGAYSMLNGMTHHTSGNYAQDSRGLRFRLDADIFVTHLLHYRGTNVCLWTDAGELLYEAPVTNTPGSWSETELVDPIPLYSGMVYRVSTEGGIDYRNYASAPRAFAHGQVLNSCYSADGFPSSTYTSYRELIDFRYAVGHQTPIAILPTNAVEFVAGVWTGKVVAAEYTEMAFLRAETTNGLRGDSNTFRADYIGDLAVSLPGYITIPAGTNQVTFDVAVVDDADTDGTSLVSVLAQAPGYIPDSSNVSIDDNDPHHLLVEGVSGDIPLFDSASVTVSARTIDNLPLTGFAEPVNLSAAGDRGDVAVSPGGITSVVDGVGSASIAFGNIGNDVVLLADGGGITGTSDVFNVVGAQIAISPDSLTNALVVAGDTATQTLVISNSGNADLEFEIQGVDGGADASNKLDEGLLAYYPFNGNANDASGNGHDGTVFGGLAYETNGIAGGAAIFNGSNAKIQVPHADDLSLEGSFSIACWIKSDGTSPASGLLAKIQSGSPRNGYILAANLTGVSADIKVNVNKNWPLIQGTAASTNQVLDGNWHHIVATYDEDMLSLYLDGQLEAQTVYTNGLTVNTLPLYIGWDPYASNRYFSGMLDEIRIYNRPLAAAEIADLYGESQTTGLVAFYPFNGNANDETGNGHNGTVNGATLTADRFGNPASAYDFNGSSDYINCGNIINGFSKFTVSAWVNIDAYTDLRYMGPWSQQRFTYQTENSNYHFYTAHDSSVSAFGTVMRWDDGIGINTRLVYSLPVNEWHLLTQVYDGNEVRQYDNDVLLNTTVTGSHSLSNDLNFLVGKACAYPGYLLTRYFDGQIDDLRIYNRALSDAEIIKLFNEADSSTSNPLEKGLVASYPFSGNANDESGNGYDGTLIDATLMTNRFGDADSAYYFDGVNDRIGLPAAVLNFERTNSFSQSLWIKSSDTSVGNNIVAKMTTDTAARGMNLVLANGVLHAQLINNNTGGNRMHVNGSTYLSDNRWHHLVVTYDGSSKASGIAIYVDGALENKTIVSDSLTATIVNNVSPTLASRGGISTYNYQGAIDDVRIYNRELSADEVAALYTGDEGGGDTATSPWLTADPLTGTVPPGSNITVSLTFAATNMVAGDHSTAALAVICNDLISPSNRVAASMWIVPPAPVMEAEPESTPGFSNTVFWSAVAGPVEYLAEVSETTNTAAMEQSNWLAATNQTFGALTAGTVYYYRVKASVNTAIGRREGPWSGWVWSTQTAAIADADTDGMDDAWELQHFGNLSTANALTDADGDGQSDLDEFITGMDPTNAVSYFAMYNVDTTSNGYFVVYWESVSGRVYSVHWTPSLTNAFGPIGTNIRYPQGSYTDELHQAEGQGYYKVEVEQE